MTLLSLILAMLIEQAWSRPGRKARGWLLCRVLRAFSAGTQAPGQAAWWLVMIPGTLAGAVLHFLLWHLHPVLAFAFNVLVLYLTLGFRSSLHVFTAIQVALRLGEAGRAQALLADWCGEVRPPPETQPSAAEVARRAIEQALVRAHRDVFGVVFWFVILPGPSGAVMYRLASELAERSRVVQAGAGKSLARRAFELLDAFPARLTALSFSVVGNFEDAIYCWRTQAVLWPDRSSGILIASGGGALGVRLGMPIHEHGELQERPEMGAEGEADADYMQGTVGLVWRALMVCLLLLAVGSIAGWVGG